MKGLTKKETEYNVCATKDKLLLRFGYRIVVVPLAVVVLE